ncbi:ABC transporter substrate-binding protein [Microbacterium sp. E-13]|uniref:ABC transporter substrate-binding protein n=1 Tax=Microbacterium sp. E-13 TaxID=3404048 RepID=UPI003CF8CEEC
MNYRKLMAAAAMGAILTSALTACAPNAQDGGSNGGEGESKEITWWATNQSSSLDADLAILEPELEKFEKATGTHVNVEVIAWKDLYGRITSAVTSGKSPDVVSIGNTWSSSLQSTGAFTEFDKAALEDLGGEDRFLQSSFETTGVEGEAPTAIPLLAQAYGLFYNKELFTAAGLEPPTTWDELTAAADKLTDGDVWGLTFPGASYTANLHMSFIFGRQHGAEPFTSKGEPSFDTDEQVAGIQQFTELWQDGYINPSDVQFTSGTEALQAFAAGKAAMAFGQTGALGVLRNAGMSPDDFGVVPIPAPSPLPKGGENVTSFAAGTNISIFKDSQNQASAKALIKFLTSDEEQLAINKAYGTMPVVNSVPASEIGDPAYYEVFQNVLAESAEALPAVANEGEYETNVGNAVSDLLRQIVSGSEVGADEIGAALTAAEEKMS